MYISQVNNSHNDQLRIYWVPKSISFTPEPLCCYTKCILYYTKTEKWVSTLNTILHENNLSLILIIYLYIIFNYNIGVPVTQVRDNTIQPIYYYLFASSPPARSPYRRLSILIFPANDLRIRLLRNSGIFVFLRRLDVSPHPHVCTTTVIQGRCV